jgi:hypothetical protein
MAETTRFYTEGGMPSNRQVAGVRNTRVWGSAEYPVVVATLYDLFELDADEVITTIGVDVLTASAAGSADVTIGGTAVPGLATAQLDLTSTGKRLATFIAGTTVFPAVGTGTVEITFTGATVVDVNVFAVVSRVESPETFTKVDTPAP